MYSTFLMVVQHFSILLIPFLSIFYIHLSLRFRLHISGCIHSDSLTSSLITAAVLPSKRRACGRRRDERCL